MTPQDTTDYTNRSAPTLNAPHGPSTPEANRNITKIAVISTLGALLFGYDTGVISGALLFMKDDLHLTSSTEGFVVSSLLVGAAFGAALGGRIADAVGRKKTIIIAAVIFGLGALGTALSPNIAAMATARVVLGLAVGCASATVPLYIGEHAPAHRRGRLVTQNELMIVTGQLLAFTINALMDQVWDGSKIWRWMLGVAAVPAVLLFFGMMLLPDTPRWYAYKGRYEDAKRALSLTRAPQEAAKEFTEIRQSIERHKNEKRGGWADLKEPWIRRIFLIGVGIAICQQITGINTVMYYAPSILEDTGMDDSASLVATITVGVISVVMTLVGVRLYNRLSRRQMLISGQIGLTTMLCGLSLVFTLPESTFRSYLVLTFMTLHVAFQQCLISTVTWLMLSEIFPVKIRGFAMGVAIWILWMVNFSIAQSFPMLTDSVGPAWTFAIFVIFNVGAITFTTKCLPETRGRSLEQLEEEFRVKYA